MGTLEQVVLRSKAGGFDLRTVICLAIVIVLARNSTLSYFIPSLLTGLIGFVTCAFILVYIVIVKDLYPQFTQGVDTPKLRRFKFTRVGILELNRQFQVSEDVFKKPIFPATPEISSQLDEFISAIIRNFIDVWFHHISNSSLLEDDIRFEFHQILRSLVSRLQHVDIANMLVLKFLPVVHDHFKAYLNAVEHASQGKSLLMMNSNQYQMTVARLYNKGKIHRGVTIKNSDPNFNEKKYLRAKVSLFLPLLLSSRERDSQVSVTLVTEILSCSILTNIFLMLGEGDFYNLLIIKLIGDNLKHRVQVKQLIAALEQHTLNHVVNTQKYTVTENMDHKHVQALVRSIHSFNSVEEVEQVSQYIKVQLKSTSTMSTTMISNLNILKDAAKDRIVFLAQSERAVLERLLLQGILNNESSLKMFAEFLLSRNRESLLCFWKAVDKIRAPLEEGEGEEGDFNLKLEFSDVEDIKEIYRLLCDPNSAFHIDQSKKLIVAELFNTFPSARAEISAYQSSRKALFSLQRDCYEQMAQEDFLDFKKTPEFERYLKICTFSPPQKEFNVTGNSEVISPEVLKAVESAFTQIMKSPSGDALAKSKSTMSLRPNLLHDSIDDYLENEKKKVLFGDSLSLFGDRTNDQPSSGGDRNSRLFDDISYEDNSDIDSLSEDSIRAGSEDELSDGMTGSTLEDSHLFMAAPGNLSLAEEISKLNGEITKLKDQLQILQPLIKKAELTNNTTELKILKKSKISLDREINGKNLQKQQYIVQENDNSLYGKSRVSIQSYISGNDGGQEFILYIIEVQKLSPGDVVSAGWIVARRFSQFFTLHQYLKLRYPEQVSPLKFPKRTTTMSVLKIQQRQMVELRKAALQEYLQKLIKIPEVCSNKAFRSFLSLENFTLRKNQPFEEKLAVDIKPKNNIELVANKLYAGISNKFAGTGSETSSPQQESFEDETFKDMQRELKQYDETGNAIPLISSTIVKVPFVKLICEFLITVFRLKGTKSWLRGKALIVILQQVFGTTIEKKITDQVKIHLQSKESILRIMTILHNTVFPGGKFKDPPVIRTTVQKNAAQQEALVLLDMFMTETCTKVFGLSNTRYATSNLFGMIQNDYLNKHLLFEIFDEILDEIFPEIDKKG